MEILYEKKHEEEEKARIEGEAMIKAKKEGREKAEAQRKSTRDKMFKSTRYGQPVMKYRIEHLLETIQGSGKPDNRQFRILTVLTPTHRKWSSSSSSPLRTGE
ncbi:hypothetical protein Q3G72_013793 [Acer saccharum]|nr:hypothetical protein Q3G72_013793 [Acer saccharum]